MMKQLILLSSCISNMNMWYKGYCVYVCMCVVCVNVVACMDVCIFEFSLQGMSFLYVRPLGTYMCVHLFKKHCNKVELPHFLFYDLFMFCKVLTFLYYHKEFKANGNNFPLNVA